MGVLSNMFGKNKKVSEKPLFNWILLTEISQILYQLSLGAAAINSLNN